MNRLMRALSFSISMTIAASLALAGGPLDSQAEKLAEAYFKKAYASCDGFFFRRSSSASFAEFDKDLTYKLLPWTLNRSDDLNNLDWLGDIVVRSSAQRNSSLDREPWHVPDRAEKVRLSSDAKGPTSALIDHIVDIVHLSHNKSDGKWYYDRTPVESLQGSSACVAIPDTLANKADRDAKEQARLSAAKKRKDEEDRAAAIEREQTARAERARQEVLRKEEEKRLARQRELAEIERLMKVPITALELDTQSKGYWVDSGSGLMWAARDVHESDGVWADSCACKQMAGFSDWRVPSIQELTGIFDPQKSHPFLINGFTDPYHIAGGIMLASVWLASSTTEGPRAIESYSFRLGKSSSIGGADGVLCVRAANDRPSGVSACPAERVAYRVEQLTAMQMAIDAPKGTYEAPKIASAVEFSYTEEARKARFLGGTTLVVGIDANGTPQNPHLIGRPLGMGLDQSLIDTVLQWRFVPATKAGKPTVGQCMLAIRFVP